MNGVCVVGLLIHAYTHLCTYACNQCVRQRALLALRLRLTRQTRYSRPIAATFVDNPELNPCYPAWHWALTRAVRKKAGDKDSVWPGRLSR